MLALDPPGNPTVGACLAGDLSGPRRHRYGAMRDLVIGVTIVLADGTVASSGGKVVKNVAGYDLGKLFSGSRGRLGLIARVGASSASASGERGDRCRRGQRAPRRVARPAADVARPGCGRLPPAESARAPLRGLRGGRRGRGRAQSGPRQRARGLGGERERQTTPRAAALCWQECLLARPGAGLAYLAASAERGWSPLAERIRTQFDPSGILADGSRADRRLCALWLLPADLPHLRALARGDGFPARTHLAHEGHARGHSRAEHSTVAEHFDRCLGCMACLTSCPSGVHYDRLIELRAASRRARCPAPAARAAAAEPRSSRSSRTRAACGRRSASAPFPLRGRSRRSSRSPRPGSRTSRRRSRPGPGERVARVGLLDRLHPVGALRRGQPRLGAGAGRLRLRGRAPYARLLRRAPPPRRAPPAGARTRAPQRGRLRGRGRRAPRHQCRRLRLAPQGRPDRLPVLDISEALVGPSPQLPPARAPRRLPGVLPPRPRPAGPRAAARPAGVDPGLELVEVAEQDLCCGSAGIYNLVQPEAARELGDRKAARVLEAAPDSTSAPTPAACFRSRAALRRAGRPLPAAHPSSSSMQRYAAPPRRRLASDAGGIAA